MRPSRQFLPDVRRGPRVALLGVPETATQYIMQYMLHRIPRPAAWMSMHACMATGAAREGIARRCVHARVHHPRKDSSLLGSAPQEMHNAPSRKHAPMAVLLPIPSTRVSLERGAHQQIRPVRLCSLARNGMRTRYIARCIGRQDWREEWLGYTDLGAVDQHPARYAIIKRLCQPQPPCELGVDVDDLARPAQPQHSPQQAGCLSHDDWTLRVHHSPAARRASVQGEASVVSVRHMLGEAARKRE